MAGVPYPTMRYHPTEPPRMVNTVDEEQALGAPWRAEPYSADETATFHNQQAMQEAQQRTAPNQQAMRTAQTPPTRPPTPDVPKDEDEDEDKAPVPRRRP